MRAYTGIWILWVGMMLSCTEYMPKPRGYFRIEPPVATYRELPGDSLPYTFRVSDRATIEFPSGNNSGNWLNLTYPFLHVKLYCSYLSGTPLALKQAEKECRALVMRQARYPDQIREQSYRNPGAEVYGSLFLLDGESASPVQFLLTDSVSRFFRGALYYDCVPNADSLAPVTRYMEQDIIELIQSFNWKK